MWESWSLWLTKKENILPKGVHRLDWDGFGWIEGLFQPNPTLLS